MFPDPAIPGESMQADAIIPHTPINHTFAFAIVSSPSLSVVRDSNDVSIWWALSPRTERESNCRWIGQYPNEAVIPREFAVAGLLSFKQMKL
jgi:hypothetical protein